MLTSLLICAGIYAVLGLGAVTRRVRAGARGV
jgi:hypothetical protein